MENSELNSVKSKMKQDFNAVYEPLLRQFIEEIKDVDKENLPIPFIPVFGEKYEKAEYRIAFVGWETRNNSDLSKFIQLAEEKPDEALNYFSEVLDIEDEYNLTNYGNNFGTGFWNFVMKFLALFHGINDWEEIKNQKHPDILQSFVWGNLDSIERYEVSAKARGGRLEEWKKVKKASLIFDKASHILNVFKPKILIILMWRDDDKWLTEGMEIGKDFEEKTILEDELEYYYINYTDTHVYWTKHPRGMNNNLDFYINLIMRHIINIKIFFELPNQQNTARIIELIDGIEKSILDFGELAECDTLDKNYEPFFRINSYRIYFNPYLMNSEKKFQIKLLVFKDKLEQWKMKQIEFDKRFTNINWAETMPIGGWYLIGTKTYYNINDLDTLQFQDYLKSIYNNDWLDIVKKLKGKS